MDRGEMLPFYVRAFDYLCFLAVCRLPLPDWLEYALLPFAGRYAYAPEPTALSAEADHG